MVDSELTPSPARTSTPVDRHVGRRIRGKRRALGLSEENLAIELGLETVRIVAYERAVERVPSDHLLRLSEILDVPVSYFFPGTPLPNL
jgi:transcriptional regulator with XRE-family HTH domain